VTAARDEAPVALRRLLPTGGELSADELVGALRFAELAGPQRPYVAVNMVATVDGRATISGRTAPMSSVADRQVFHALRTRVDAVLVGAGTVRTERYGRLVRDPARREQRRAAGLQADPLAVVVSGRLELPADLPLLQEPEQRVVVITASSNVLEGCAAQVQYLRSSPVDLAGALARLRADHGVRSILCEGGPSLNASLLAAGLIDELFLTTAPTIAGGAGALTIITGTSPDEQPRPVELVWLLAAGGELFARYRLPAA
jgi:riboflavin-specific deaminase-like protein